MPKRKVEEKISQKKSKKLRSGSKEKASKVVTAPPVDPLTRRIDVIKEYDNKVFKSSQDLVDDSRKRGFFLQFTFSKCKSANDPKPTYLKLPHPVYADVNDCEICLFVKSPQRQWKDKAAQEEKDLPMLRRVIDLDHLKKKFPTPKDKRHFMNAYDLFLADKNIVCSLPAILGRGFAEAKKMPHGIKLLSSKPMASTIIESLYNAQIFMRPGDTTSIRIGSKESPTEHLVDNAKVVMKFMKERVEALKEEDGKLEEGRIEWQILSLHVRLAESLSVPIIDLL